MRTTRLFLAASAAILLLSVAAPPEAKASSRSTCYFEVKLVRAPDKKQVATFKVLRISKRHNSIGGLCKYLVKPKVSVKAKINATDAKVLRQLKAGKTVVLRLEAASWCGGGPKRRCGSYRRWHLVP